MTAHKSTNTTTRYAAGGSMRRMDAGLHRSPLPPRGAVHKPALAISPTRINQMACRLSSVLARAHARIKLARSCPAAADPPRPHHGIALAARRLAPVSERPLSPSTPSPFASLARLATSLLPVTRNAITTPANHLDATSDSDTSSAFGHATPVPAHRQLDNPWLHAPAAPGSSACMDDWAAAHALVSLGSSSPAACPPHYRLTTNTDADFLHHLDTNGATSASVSSTDDADLPSLTMCSTTSSRGSPWPHTPSPDSPLISTPKQSLPAPLLGHLPYRRTSLVGKNALGAGHAAWSPLLSVALHHRLLPHPSDVRFALPFNS
ncbi:hypothetical protein BC831DRAFT_474320 [Entophlyctis helioformis]|nr:hypothetical protein BC831DRAFT_474320 [Entophlyctis helioformis]